jgi:hypothetical protein
MPKVKQTKHQLFKFREKEQKCERRLVKAHAHIGQKESQSLSNIQCTSSDQNAETPERNQSINYVKKKKRKNAVDMSKLEFQKLGKPLPHMVDQQELGKKISAWSFHQKKQLSSYKSTI